MLTMYNETVDYLKTKLPFTPEVAIIVGTGLKGLTKDVENPIEIPYATIPGFTVCSAPSHSGVLHTGYLGGKPVIVFNGRFHYYEGYTMQQVVYPVRIAHLLGVKYLLVTNAAGSLNENLQPGNIVMIKDHINFMGTNPLIGPNTLTKPVVIDGKQANEFGERFPSMNAPYDATLQQLTSNFAKTQGIEVKQGVYCGLTGPSLETKAECLMLKCLGADLVGMSTVPEVIAAVHCGLRVLAMSVVTNMSNIFHDSPHTQTEIQENANIASKNLLSIFKGILAELR